MGESIIDGANMIVDNGFTAAILTSQADYSRMPAVDSLLNASPHHDTRNSGPSSRSRLSCFNADGR
jgi:hypothetical protein